jgi:threonine dehydratase
MSSSIAPRAPTYEDIAAAAARLSGKTVVTPLLESPVLNERLGGRLLLKAEMLQRTGSFKFRGAFNRLSQIPVGERSAGVVAFSSGNHAQGVAAAAGILGIPATIVMPRDAPQLKIANTRGYGAEVVLYDRLKEDREAIARKICGERGAVLVPPFDDPDIIAGQGTAGIEIARQAHDMGAKLDAVLVPCSGGGLVSGIATALERESPGTAVYAAEPEGFDDTARSLAAGERQILPMGQPSLCDALLVPTPGVITFPINRRLLKGSLVVSDAAVLSAMAEAFLHFKVVIEPGGAIALAADLAGIFAEHGKTVAVVGSGGNVDANVFDRALALAR